MGRTLHQAMAYLGLAEQDEPKRSVEREDRYDRKMSSHDGEYIDATDDVFYSEDRDEYEFISSGSTREEQQEKFANIDFSPTFAQPELQEKKLAHSELRVLPDTQSDEQPHRETTRSVQNFHDSHYDESEDQLRQITTIHPRSYNDAKIIGESFRENIPVIMNVTDMGEAEAKRLVDFSAGLAFALHGSIERVTDKVFLLTPANLEVLGAEGAEVPVALDSESSDLFNQG